MMQKDHPETPKIRRIKRVRNTCTLEPVKKNVADNTTNVRTGSSHNRTTMASSDFSLIQNLTRRKVGMERVSLLPTQVSLDSTRIMDTDCSDVVLKLQYDEYMQKIMTEIILKQKTKGKEKLFLCQLATIAKEYEQSQEMLFKLKTRQRDIINLDKLQTDIDAQITDVNNCTKGEGIKTLENILSRLDSLLKPLDVLRCTNIILPDTQEEWEETNKVLKSTSETLKSLMALIGTNKESYESVNNGIKEFLNTFNDIENHQKRLSKELSNFQVLVLKSASLSLMQNYN